jgi:hypothetical protein
LRQRSTFHMAMGNRKKAIKDLTKALKIDPFYTEAREIQGLRLGSWYGQLKDGKPFTGSSSGSLSASIMKMIEEMKLRLVGLPSPYHFERPIPRNHSGCQNILREMSQSHNADELYGKRTKEELPPVLDILHRNFQQHPEAVNFQRDLQHIIQGMGGTFVEEKGGLETKFSCVTCGALQGSNGGIMKCSSRCRLVSYCSKDCQRAVSCFFIHVLYYLLLLLYTNFLFIIGNLISLSLF